MPGAGEEEQKNKLIFAKTIAGNLIDLTKCQYLLRAAEGIATLQMSFPEDPKKCLRFVTSGPKVKGATYDELVECIELLESFGDALINDVANPVVRTFILCYGKVKVACASANADPIAKTLPGNLMKELAACKLGVEVQGVQPVPPLGPHAQELATSVVKIVEATLRKLPNGDSSPWLAALTRLATPTVVAAGKEDVAKPVEAPTVVAAVKEDMAKPVAAPTVVAPVEAGHVLLGSSGPETAVGDVVIVRVEKPETAKQNFNGQEARVVEVLSKALRLEMLGGPRREQSRNLRRVSAQ